MKIELIFTQDADDLAAASVPQTLRFEVLDGGAGKYTRFKTGGWAIESLADFKALYDVAAVAFGMDKQTGGEGGRNS